MTQTPIHLRKEVSCRRQGDGLIPGKGYSLPDRMARMETRLRCMLAMAMAASACHGAEILGYRFVAAASAWLAGGGQVMSSVMRNPLRCGLRV